MVPSDKSLLSQPCSQFYKQNKAAASGSGSNTTITTRLLEISAAKHAKNELFVEFRQIFNIVLFNEKMSKSLVIVKIISTYMLRYKV